MTITHPTPAPEPAQRLGFRSVALGVATLVAVMFALINLGQQRVYRLPTDFAHWQLTAFGLEATGVDSGESTPIQTGDRLLAVNGLPVTTPEAIARRLAATGQGGELQYQIERAGALENLNVKVGAATPAWPRYAVLEFAALLYLVMGLFVAFRRSDAPDALHFYLFSLVSFVLFSFHYTGKWNAFDQSIFWGNEIAWLLAPALFLDFALRFEPRSKLAAAWPSALRAAVYAPAGLLLGVEALLAAGRTPWPAALSATQALLDRGAALWFSLAFLLAAWVFAAAARRASGAVAALRSQALWLSWGTLGAILPLTLFWAAPYLAGLEPPAHVTAALLPLLLIPLVCIYAMVRFRLLEAEIIFRRGVVYTLATAGVVAIFFGLIGLLAVVIHTRMPQWSMARWMAAIALTALLFEPLKNRIQERLDRLFYRERYDYRRTLAEFARQLGAHPELETLLPLVLERLGQTLSVDRAAIFVSGEHGFELARGRHLQPDLGRLDLGFLDAAASARSSLIFIENPRQASALPPTASVAAGRLDLNYYVACRLQGRAVAFLGLGKTARGEFLSSDDLSLVETLAGSLAIAIENAHLYATLRQKVADYERLKDFNENIVESIQVGVIAVDLENRVTSWNAQMEVVSALPRELALGCPLAGLLGPDFGREFTRALGQSGIHTVSKFRFFVGGCDRIANLAIAPLVTRRFEMMGRIVLLNDITAEVELEERLIQADRLRSVGLLAAGVAHEVNTPLAVISSYTQILAKQVPAGDPRARMLETITRQTFRASEIVGNLLNFSRTGEAEFRSVELNAVLRDTLALVEPALRAAAVQTALELTDAELVVQGDAGKLQQVFLNLVLNARDAMPQGGRLHLRSGEAGGQAWVEIADTGAGISSDIQHRIFDPFFTTKKADRGPHGGLGSGTGLGLAVTYGIVQEHGGSIQVQSAAGSGATFRVVMPRVELPAPVAAPAHLPAPVAVR